jgi:hypothetical protein
MTFLCSLEVLSLFPNILLVIAEMLSSTLHLKLLDNLETLSRVAV